MYSHLDMWLVVSFVGRHTQPLSPHMALQVLTKIIETEINKLYLGIVYVGSQDFSFLFG